ncbi:MAG: F0F1 ATP synthase subunit B family protein [Candidatus Nitrospinota bacterium M3_3B_026]
MIRRVPVLSPVILLAAAGAAHAAGLEHAENWDWARDGGRILNAGVVLGLVGWMLVRYGKPFFQKRAESIADRFASIEESRRQAETKLAEYEKRLAAAGAEAEKIRKEAEAEGELIRKRAIAQAEEAAEKIMEKASERIGMETRAAREKLMKEAAGAAVELAEEILKKNLGPEDQKKLVENYLEKMERVN